MKDACRRVKQANAKRSMKRKRATNDRRALTCLTIFAIGMEIVTATRSTETYDSKQKSEEDVMRDEC